jgi:hypothetical protein
MKSACYLLAVLALGAWSMNPAAAAHRSHGTYSVGSHHHFGAASRNHAGALAGMPQTHGSDGNSAVTDHPKRSGAKDGVPLAGTDKAGGDEERLHGSSKLEKTGADRGINGKPDADAAIDTRIPAYHGREADRSHKSHPSKIADDRAGILRHQHVGTLHQLSHLPSFDARRRNAVGATLEHDKTGEHRNAVGVAVVPPASTAGAAPKTGPASPPPPGAQVRDANAHPTGNPPANASLSGATPGPRGAVVPAPIVAAANGLSIAGSDLIRPVSRTAAIGGPARIASGVISGNTIRLKHP